jgi:BON domain
MFRHMNQGVSMRIIKSVTLVSVLGWSVVATAQTQESATKTIPDAQVEANVLKALAGAPDLANQAITTTTVYGVVTLSGSVQTEALRTEAETIASRTSGVQKVVDEMTLSGDSANTQPPQDSGSAVADSQGTNPALQSDGTMAQGPPDANNAQGPNPSPNEAAGPNYGPGAPEYRQPYNGRHAPPPPPGYAQGPSGQPQGYGPQPVYPPQQGYNGAPQRNYGGQEAGLTVTVPTGAMVRMRINQTLDSAHAKPGQHFDGIVVNDVVADGAVAIPRGASVEGVVVDAKSSGSLTGRGELSLQLTQVTLAGRVYPVVSDVWAHNGGDKTVQTVNNTAIGTGIGALFGAAAGGGEGAAIGAGVGAALGLGSSAASGRGQVYVPSEGLLTFHLEQPATLATVSQQEMDRLAQGVRPGAEPQRLQRRYYPAPYYGPMYYRPYPYPYPYPY